MTQDDTRPDVYRPHASQVEAMSGYGLPPESVALVLEIDVADLERDYARELKTGAIKANARVAESLFRRATGDGHQSVTAAIFWMKTRAGWKETQVQEVTAPTVVKISWADDRL